MSVLRRRTVSFLVFCLLSLHLAAQSLALDVPNLKGRINDYANLLSPATEASLESVLKSLESTDSTQIVVLTIDSLRGDSLEQFSLRVVEDWKIGQQGLDNGVLLLVARDDRKIRIEVGYGPLSASQGSCRSCRQRSVDLCRAYEGVSSTRIAGHVPVCSQVFWPLEPAHALVANVVFSYRWNG